ncbi:hypothetical protein SALBM135S_04753 [Streptomyces alboniger]
MTPGTGTGREREAVHLSSGNRLGASHPRQEGPVDLRLVPPALAAWVTAALTLDASPRWAVTAVVTCLVAAGVLLVTWTARGRPRIAPERGAPPGRHRLWGRLTVAAVLLCTAASAGVRGSARRGPAPWPCARFGERVRASGGRVAGHLRPLPHPAPHGECARDATCRGAGRRGSAGHEGRRFGGGDAGAGAGHRADGRRGRGRDHERGRGRRFERAVEWSSGYFPPGTGGAGERCAGGRGR